MMGAVSRLIKHPKTQRGFTIVEVMIVLAITGVLFVAITATLSGKRQKTEFNQAINAVKTEIEQYINEVQTGHYPTDSSFNCVDGNIVASGAAVEQGANNSCVYLGRVLQFGNGYGSDPQYYGIYTIVGTRDKASFEDSDPKIVSHSSTQQKKPLQFGLELVSMKSGGASVGAVAFVASMQSGGSSSLLHGSLADNDVVAIDTPIAGFTESNIIANIESRLQSSHDTRLNPSSGVELCFRDGYNENQSGLITIGGAGGTSTVSLSIKGTGNCT